MLQECPKPIIGNLDFTRDLELVDSKWNGSQSCSLTHECEKEGYYYIFVESSGYKSGSYGGDCVIKLNNVTIDNTDYLFKNNQVNINSAFLAKLYCQIGDSIDVTATGRGTSYYGNAILILA